MLPCILRFLQQTRWCGQAHKEQILITSLRACHWFPSEQHDMNRETCLKLMSHWSPVLSPEPGIQVSMGAAGSPFNALLRSQGQARCWVTRCHIPLSHFPYDMMRPDTTCLEGWKNVISVSTGTEHQATKPKHAGGDSGNQWTELFFSFGEITLRHSHESFFTYFT